MRSPLALASILHADPAQVLATLSDVLADEGGPAFTRRGSELERRAPLTGVEQWRVLPHEEGARVECELVVPALSSALARFVARRRVREAPERFRAVVTAVAAVVEDR